MVVMDDMDICLNVSGGCKSTEKSASNSNNDMCIKRLKKHSDDKVKKPFKKFHSIESSKSLLSGAKKRIKQKSLATIVAKNLKKVNQSKEISKCSILKKSDLTVSNKNSKLITSTTKNKKLLIKDNMSNYSNKKGSENGEISVLFTKPLKDVSYKTILCKKRNNDTDEKKKSLSSIFKTDDSKTSKLLTNNYDTHKFIDQKPKQKIQPIQSKQKIQSIQPKRKLDNVNDGDKFNNPVTNFKKLKDKGKNFNTKIETKKINMHLHKNGKFFSLFSNNPLVPNIGQRLVKPVNETLFSAEKFSELGIHSFSISNLEQNMKITTMTTVQKKAIPIILSGNDTLIRSQTGSGKTLSYALPIIEYLQSVRPKLTRSSGTKALVVVPTRELALQTYECFLKLIKPFTWIVPGYLVGGEKRKAEKARLRKGCNVLVATPGRLLDHIKHTKVLKLDSVKYFVLDEADRMFDMGYEKDISGIITAIENRPSESNNSEYDPLKILRRHINPNSNENNENETVHNEKLVGNNLKNDSNLKKNISIRSRYNSNSDEEFNCKSDLEVPKLTSRLNNKKEKVGEEMVSDKQKVLERQTILLSATLTPAVEKLAGLTMHNPVFVDAAKDNNEVIGETVNDTNENLVVPQSVMQSYIVTPPKLRMVTLSAYIIGKCQNNKNHKILIFMATQDMIDYHAQILSSILNKPINDEDEDSECLADVEFFKLHGNMSQIERTEVFKTFKQVKSGVLLCTDVASRGLDLPEVDVVVQYTGPTSTRDYVHRIGRTGRAGSSGTATIFLTPPEVEFARMLEACRIRIKQDDMDEVLGALLTPLSQHSSVREAATALQDDLENSVLESKKMYAMACKAYTSWVRFYSTYSREMREVFNRKNLHLGHYAKSFALRDPPQKIGSCGKQIREKEEAQQSGPKHQNRLANPRPDGVRKKRVLADQQQDCRNRKLKNVRMLNTCEYASGLEPIKKSKKS